MEVKILNVGDREWKDILEIIQHDIYHLPEYNLLEAKRTNTIPQAFLATEGDKVFFVPYLIRSCQDIVGTETETFDVSSSYGYPGILLSKSAKNDRKFANHALDSLQKKLQKQGVCSGFFRLHPILNDNLVSLFPPDTFCDNGTTVSIDLTNSLEQMWKDTKSNHRNKINRCTKKFALKASITKFSEGIDIFCQLCPLLIVPDIILLIQNIL